MSFGFLLILIGCISLLLRRRYYALLCQLADEVGLPKPSNDLCPFIIFYAALILVGAYLVIESLVAN